MPIVTFSDVDDTLCQSQRKCTAGDILSPAATNSKGQNHSFFTPQQQHLLTLLQKSTLIPVTGRRTDALNRVNIPFSSYQIASHGALVMTPKGQIDPEWFEYLEQMDQTNWANALSDYADHANELIQQQGLQLRCNLIVDQGYTVYVSIKGDSEQLSVLVAQLTVPAGARSHINDRDFALMPPYTKKETAVAFLQQRFRQEDASTLFLGVGDSHTDLPFLKLCDFALIPQAAQIMEKLS